METTETLATGGMDWDNTHWENPNATKKPATRHSVQDEGRAGATAAQQ